MRYCLLKQISFDSVMLNLFDVAEQLVSSKRMNVLVQLLLLVEYCN